MTNRVGATQDQVVVYNMDDDLRNSHLARNEDREFFESPLDFQQQQINERLIKLQFRHPRWRRKKMEKKRKIVFELTPVRVTISTKTWQLFGFSAIQNVDHYLLLL